MRNVTSLGSVLPRSLSTGLHAGGDLRSLTSSRRQAMDEPLLPAVDEARDTMGDLRHGPARGIVLAFGPALLVWGGLIAMLVRLVR